MPKPRGVRTRELPGISFSGAWSQKGPGYSLAGVNKSSVAGKGTQITVSEGHHWPPPKGELSDNGGNFSTSKSYVLTEGLRSPFVSAFFYDDGNDITYSYKGGAYPVIPGSVSTPFPPVIASSDARLDELGATAISRCKPTNPPADVSVFLGELMREGIPNLVGSSLWRDRTAAARKKAGDEYLNVQFGWLPLVSGLRKIADATAKADTVLAQYERDAGKVVRRRFRFPSKTETESVTLGNGVPWDVTNSGHLQQLPYGVISRVRKSRTETWFSGAFTYAMPSGYESRNKLARLAAEAKIVYGLELTPDTVWNLTPWSWAVDWFSNAGDVISNISDFANQGLVMRYGYIMEHTTVSDTYTLSGTPYKGTTFQCQPLTLVTETKKRRAANPFGFGVTFEGISTFQASILAALGMTRGRR